jgi:SOS-response transcriptional repressor LexA
MTARSPSRPTTIDRQEQALDLIRAAAAEGRTLSFRELTLAMGYASPRATQKVINHIRARGLLTPTGPIRLQEPDPCDPCHDSSTQPPSNETTDPSSPSITAPRAAPSTT